MASGKTEMSFLGGSSCYVKKCVFDCFKNKKKMQQFFEKRNINISLNSKLLDSVFLVLLVAIS